MDNRRGAKWSQVGRRRVGALVGVRSARKSSPSASRVGSGPCESRALPNSAQISLQAAGPPLPLPYAERAAHPACHRASSLRLSAACGARACAGVMSSKSDVLKAKLSKLPSSKINAACEAVTPPPLLARGLGARALIS